MVIGQADHTGAQLNVTGTVCGDADENFRAGDGFPAGAMVLTDPRFIESEGVQPLYELEISLESQGGILVDAMKGGHEDAKLHSFRKSHVRSRSFKQAMVRPKLR